MQKRVSHAAPERFAAIDVGSRKLLVYFGISVLLHIILMGVFVVMPSLTPSRRFIPSAVNVSLVSLPAPSGGAAAPQKPVAAAQIPEPAPKPEPVAPAPVKPPPPPPKPAAEVSTAPAPKPEPKKKEPVKPKEPPPAEVIKNAVSKMEKEVAKPRQRSWQDTIDRLRQQVEKEDRPAGAAAGAGSEPPGSAAGSRYGTGLTASQFRSQVEIYQAEIKYQVQKNWAFSELLSGGRTDLTAVILFKIRPNGEISDIRFDRKSGNAHLDESAYRAIVKSSPLPPLPAGLFNGDYGVALGFGTKGIK